MNPKIERFFHKHDIKIDDIKYIIRDNGSTAIYTLDERRTETYLPVKDFIEALPPEKFLHPNKGIIIAASQIINVVDGHYIMADGRQFKYRINNSKTHDIRLLMLGRQFEHNQSVPYSKENTDFIDKFSVFDHMPIPSYVVELQLKEDGFGADFVFRYCNYAMLEVENKTRDEVIGHYFYDVIPTADAKRLVVYMDVALNGTARTIVEYDRGKDALITVSCFQPMPGYCMCMLMNVAPNENSSKN